MRSELDADAPVTVSLDCRHANLLVAAQIGRPHPAHGERAAPRSARSGGVRLGAGGRDEVVEMGGQAENHSECECDKANGWSSGL